ncbi:MAG: hypothetical protein M1837_002832 [Sclerophora amabilis]|nr:MAG: hypothetical protein M1837_002832 [Sclerophora amabilis]
MSPLQLGLTSSVSEPLVAMNGDMDIDMDIDIQAGESEMAGLEAEAMRMEVQPSEAPAATTPMKDADPSTPIPPTDPREVAAHKVHLRGLDNLHTGDIKQFASEHFPINLPLHIEWIDDTSANLVYDTPETALRALTNFSLGENEECSKFSPLQSRMAKVLSTHTDSRLEVRLAVVGDKKQAKARERSRFYLFHPEYDPGERRRREPRDRRRGDRRRESEGNGDYQRRRYDDREERRRRDKEQDSGFEASMYDDNPSALSSRELSHSERHQSYSSYSSGNDERRNGARRVKFDRSSPRELFPARLNEKRSTNRRGRSASPMRDIEVGEDSGARSKLRSGRLRDRSYTPPSHRIRSSSPPFARANGNKELFPSKFGSRDISVELRGVSPSGPSKELFPNKSSTIVHRRSDAFDAADETADLFAGRMSVPFTDGSQDASKKPRSLADRISRVPRSTTTFKEEEATTSLPSAGKNRGFSIRGAAAQQEDQGFSIRGAAGSAMEGKELFPSKSGANSGKELFAEKLEGRGGRRRKAEDMFY